MHEEGFRFFWIIEVYNVKRGCDDNRPLIIVEGCTGYG